MLIGTCRKRENDSSSDKRDSQQKCFLAPIAPITPSETKLYEIGIACQIYTHYGEVSAEPGDILYSCKDGRLFVVPGKS